MKKAKQCGQQTRVSDIMRDPQGLVCGKYDVVYNNGGGYHLATKIVVEVHDAPEASVGDVQKATATEVATIATAPMLASGKDGNGPLNDRK